LILLSQDEARFPLVPTLRTTLGVKGFRPVVGTWDCKDLVYALAAVNVVRGTLTTRLLDCPARVRAKTGKSKCRWLQAAFVRLLRELAARYPASRFPRVVIIIDNAPWHKGALITEVLMAYPHLEFYRLPSYCPDLNPIERLWKMLRRRASHNRLFETMKALRTALRASICYFQTCCHRILSLLSVCKRQRRKSEKNLSAP
jgi:transposase